MKCNVLRLPLLLILLSGLIANAADWPQWRGPGRDGISDETELLGNWDSGGPPLKWSIETEGEGYAAVSVAGNRVYVTGSTGKGDERTGILYALNPATGEEVWAVPYGSEWGKNYSMSRSSPIIEDGKIYIYSGTGIAACIDEKDGKLLWQVDTFAKYSGQNVRWGIAESPLLYKGKMICHPGGTDSAVVALSAESGSLSWRTQGISEKSSYCSPLVATVDGKPTLITQTENNVLGIDPETGALLWKFAHRNKYGVHPNTALVIGNDKVAVSSGYGFGTQLLQIKGGKVSMLWHAKELDSHFHGILLLNNQIVGCDGKGRGLVALSIEDGSVVWRDSSIKKASLTYADERLYAHDEKGKNVSLLEIKPNGAALAGQFPIEAGEGPHWAHPVVANGTLFIRHGRVLAAYDVRKKR